MAAIGVVMRIARNTPANLSSLRLIPLLIPVMVCAHWHPMLVVQLLLATASLFCRLAVVTWLAEPLPIMAVPEEPEISIVGCNVIDMLGNGSAAFIFAEARTHGVLE
jgi:hypothetical protein